MNAEVETVNKTELRLTGNIQPLAGLGSFDYDYTDLPFVKKIKKKNRVGNKAISFWNVKPTGRFQDDCIIGRSYALEMVQYHLNEAPANVFSHVIREMPAEFTGIEVGFINTLDELILKGAMTVATKRTVEVPVSADD